MSTTSPSIISCTIRIPRSCITGMPHIDLLLAEIPTDAPFRAEHATMAIVVIRTAEGIAAYEDRCPHAFWPLSDGEVSAGRLECRGHGWEFSVENGRCLNAPAYCLTPVSVAINGNVVRLE